MSTVEKLFVQIFERKNEIIEQVKHQTDAFDHHLASKLIIEGFNPPPWLLTPSFEISSSDPKELKKEELISGLLIPCPRPPIAPYYNGLYSLYNKSALTENTGEFSDGLPVETHASNKGSDAGERQTAVPQCNNNETDIPVSGVLEPGPSATSSPNQIDARISNIYPEPDQSLARIQRSKSRQKALELRNSSKARGKICLEDNNNSYCSRGIAVSRIAFQQSNLVNELSESVKPSYTSNENTVEREAEKGDHCSLEKGGNIYSGRVTRSRSSSQPTKCVNMDGSSQVTDRESLRLAPSIEKLVQQSAYASVLLDPSDIAEKIHASREDKMGVHLSKENGSYGYSGRITRSRSSSEKACSVEESRKVDSSSNIARVDRGTQAESIPNSMQWPNHDDKFLELVEPFEIKEAAKVDIWSKEKGSVAYCGRITRSRSSYQHPNCLGGLSELDSSSNIINEDGCKFTQPISKSEIPSEPSRSIGGDAVSQSTQGKQISVRSSSQRQKYLELPAEDAREHPDEGNIADRHVGRKTRSTSFASGRSAIQNTLNRPEGLDPLKSSGSDANILPCAETINIAKQERCASTAAETEVVSDEPADSDLIYSGSNLDDTSIRVGLEVLVSKPLSDLDMFVKPKQLDFDNMEECSLKEASVPVAIKKRHGTSSSGKRCCTTLVRAESLERVTSSNCHENRVPPLKKLLLGEPEVLSKEEEARSKEEEAQTGSSGSDGEEKDEVEKKKLGYGLCPGFSASRTSNRSAVPSIKKTMGVYEMKSPHTLAEGIKISRPGHSVASKAFRKSSCEGLFENAVDSDLTNVDTVISLNLSVEKGVGEVDVVGHAKMVSEDRTVAVSLQDSVVKFPAVSVNESESCAVSQKINSGSIQVQNAEKGTPSGNSSSNDKIVGDPQSVELQVTEKLAQSGRSFSFTMEGLPQAKRRKIEGQPIDASSASPNSKTEPFQGANLNSVESNLETGLMSPYLHISCEEGVEQANASRSPDGEMEQNKKCCMEEGIKSSPKLQVIEAEHALKGREKNVNPPFTFESEQLGPPLVSSLTKQASGDFQGFLVEEAEGEGGTNIIRDLRSQCATEEHQGSLHLDDKPGPEIAENSTCMAERAMWKIHSQQEGGELFSHCSIGSSHNQYLDLFGVDQTKPVFEGFVMEEGNEKPQIAGDRISIDKLDLPTMTIERASFLEQLCLSASLRTPLLHFSTTDKYPRAPNFYQSVPNGLLEGMDLQSALSLNDDAGKLHRVRYSCLNEEASHAFQGNSSSDYRPFSSTRFAWSISKPCISPVGKLWGGSTSSSGSSEKRLSLNPELTCFPIEEDPSMSEETEQKDDVNDASHEGVRSMTITGSAIREPLCDLTEQHLNPLASVSGAEKFYDRGSLDPVNTDVNVSGTWNKCAENLQNPCESKTRGTKVTRENRNFSVAENGVKRATGSLHNRFSKPKLSGKTSLRKGGPSLSEKEPKRNNIVSNITSFVPLVQRTQGAAVVTGKRDVKVKALEAAEAAKRLEEKKENERKMKKEALKLERARLEQENLRQLELKKKKKEEERKKKEAEMAARKRLREEEEKKEKEVKRKRTEEARKQLREHEQKLRAEKEEKEKRHRAAVEKVHEKKEARDEVKTDKKVEEDNLVQKPETELRITRVSASDISKASIVLKDSEALGDCVEIQKVTATLEKASENNNLVADTSKEQSYEMSPYQSSDDEDEEEDDIPTKKFIPSWASKNYLVVAVSSQQKKLDPSMIFPPESFCCINEVLASRKQQQQK